LQLPNGNMSTAANNNKTAAFVALFIAFLL
jgi:hypothetical protein